MKKQKEKVTLLEAVITLVVSIVTSFVTCLYVLGKL